MPTNTPTDVPNALTNVPTNTPTDAAAPGKPGATDFITPPAATAGPPGATGGANINEDRNTTLVPLATTDEPATAAGAGSGGATSAGPTVPAKPACFNVVVPALFLTVVLVI